MAITFHLPEGTSYTWDTSAPASESFGSPITVSYGWVADAPTMQQLRNSNFEELDGFKVKPVWVVDDVQQTFRTFTSFLDLSKLLQRNALLSALQNNEESFELGMGTHTIQFQIIAEDGTVLVEGTEHTCSVFGNLADFEWSLILPEELSCGTSEYATLSDQIPDGNKCGEYEEYDLLKALWDVDGNEYPITELNGTPISGLDNNGFLDVSGNGWETMNEIINNARFDLSSLEIGDYYVSFKLLSPEDVVLDVGGQISVTIPEVTSVTDLLKKFCEFWTQTEVISSGDSASYGFEVGDFLDFQPLFSDGTIESVQFYGIHDSVQEYLESVSYEVTSDASFNSNVSVTLLEDDVELASYDSFDFLSEQSFLWSREFDYSDPELSSKIVVNYSDYSETYYIGKFGVIIKTVPVFVDFMESVSSTWTLDGYEYYTFSSEYPVDISNLFGNENVSAIYLREGIGTKVYSYSCYNISYSQVLSISGVSSPVVLPDLSTSLQQMVNFSGHDLPAIRFSRSNSTGNSPYGEIEIFYNDSTQEKYYINKNPFIYNIATIDDFMELLNVCFVNPLVSDVGESFEYGLDSDSIFVDISEDRVVLDELFENGITSIELTHGLDKTSYDYPKITITSSGVAYDDGTSASLIVSDFTTALSSLRDGSLWIGWTENSTSDYENNAYINVKFNKQDETSVFKYVNKVIPIDNVQELVDFFDDIFVLPNYYYKHDVSSLGVKSEVPVLWNGEGDFPLYKLTYKFDGEYGNEGHVYYTFDSFDGQVYFASGWSQPSYLPRDFNGVLTSSNGFGFYFGEAYDMVYELGTHTISLSLTMNDETEYLINRTVNITINSNDTLLYSQQDIIDFLSSSWNIPSRALIGTVVENKLYNDGMVFWEGEDEFPLDSIVCSTNDFFWGSTNLVTVAPIIEDISLYRYTVNRMTGGRSTVNETFSNALNNGSFSWANVSYNASYPVRTYMFQLRVTMKDETEYIISKSLVWYNNPIARATSTVVGGRSVTSNLVYEPEKSRNDLIPGHFYQIHAEYLENDKYLYSNGVGELEMLKAPTVTALTGSQSITYGESVTLTVTVTETINSTSLSRGSLRLYDGSTLIQTTTITSNTTSISYTPSTTGTHDLFVVYTDSGVEYNSSNSNHLNLVVNKIGTILTSDTVIECHVGDITEITGVLTDDDGNGLNGMEIQLLDTNGGSIDSVYTNSNGEFSYNYELIDGEESCVGLLFEGTNIFESQQTSIPITVILTTLIGDIVYEIDGVTYDSNSEERPVVRYNEEDGDPIISITVYDENGNGVLAGGLVWHVYIPEVESTYDYGSIDGFGDVYLPVDTNALDSYSEIQMYPTWVDAAEEGIYEDSRENPESNYIRIHRKYVYDSTEPEDWINTGYYSDSNNNDYNIWRVI